MPGLINNTNILNANNQFIQSQNDIEAALLAGSEITSEQLRIMGLWHPYLKYLKYLQSIAEQGPLAGPGERVTFPGEFQGDNEIYISEKCIAANWVYQILWDTFDWLGDKTWDKAAVKTSAFISLLSGALGVGFAGASLPVVVVAALPFLAVNYLISDVMFDPDEVLEAIEDNKEAIIRSMYNAVSLDLVELQLTLPITRLSNISEAVVEIIKPDYPLSVIEQQLIGLIIDYWSLTALFKDSISWPSKWQAGPPSNPVVCGQVDCIAGNAQLEQFPSWVWGSPSLLDNGEFISGQTTAEWDGAVYKVLFRSVLGNPISFTINSISTPSIDFTIHQCDGTYEDRNEVLASEFPITILDALEVHLARVSSAFTVSLEF